jgi:hypothetical protein
MITAQRAYRPVNTGLRCSAKARCASFVSSVEASITVCDCSTRYASRKAMPSVTLKDRLAARIASGFLAAMSRAIFCRIPGMGGGGETPTWKAGLSDLVASEIVTNLVREASEILVRSAATTPTGAA